MTGDAGSDWFVIARGQNTTRIKDYTDGEDKIVLDSPNLTFEGLTFIQNGTSSQVRFSANNELLAVLEKTDLADLDATDFIFRES